MSNRLVFCLILSLFCTSAILSQPNIKKADKQYQLFAFNLAIESYTQAMNKEPFTGETYARLADCYRNLNQMDQAERWYEKAIESKDLTPVHVFNYAQVLMTQGKYEKAKQWFQVYAATEPIVGNHYAGNCDFAIRNQAEPSDQKVMATPFNSTSSDFGLTFLGPKMVFASARSDIKKSGTSSNWSGGAQNRLFYVSIETGKTSAPQLFHAEIRSASNEGPLSFSADGKMVAFTKNNFVDGTRHVPSSGMQLSIFLADTDPAGDWAASRPFPHNSGFSTGFPCFSADGNSLYFAAFRPEGFGGYDLYVSHRLGNSWSTPENLGAAVNTRGNEISPFVDGKNLYFSSDWHAGFGGFDIFRSEKGSQGYDKVYNLGSAINSSRDDYSFVVAEGTNTAYFTSNRLGGKGYEDIYEAQQQVGEVVITVLDAAEGVPVVGALVDFASCKAGAMSTDPTGKVRRANPAEGQCLVIIKKEGYRQENLMVSIASSLQAQNLEVALKKENDIYLGMVVNASNNLGLGDVVIRVTNQNNGKSINIAADALGKFALALNPQTSYLLRFSKAGFVEVNQPIKTGDNSTRNQLSTIRMMPLSGAPAMVEATPKPADELVSRSTEEPATSAPESKSRSATPVKPPPPAVPASVPVAAPKPPATTAKSGEGFAVQVVSVSVSSGGATINDVLTKLEGLGSVYLVHEGPFEKIRIGNFSTEAEAIAIAQKVKERGYTGAYIVRENMVKETSPAMPTKVSASKPATSSQYFIRLASYKDTRWFDASKVKGLGTLEQRKKGEYTIMLLSGLGSLDDARKTLSKVKNSGFTDAQLVQDVNGELKKVEF